MQLIEITLGAEQKRPAGQYASDTKSAFVKIAVHPGDELDDVLAHARVALDRALGSSNAKPRAAAAPEFVVKFGGTLREERSFRPYGAKWNGNEFAATARTLPEAQDLARRLATFAKRRITIQPPDGDEIYMQPPPEEA